MWQIIIPSLRFGVSDTDHHRLIHEPPIPLPHTNSGVSDPERSSDRHVNAPESWCRGGFRHSAVGEAHDPRSEWVSLAALRYPIPTQSKQRKDRKE